MKFAHIACEVGRTPWRFPDGFAHVVVLERVLGLVVNSIVKATSACETSVGSGRALATGLSFTARVGGALPVGTEGPAVPLRVAGELS